MHVIHVMHQLTVLEETFLRDSSFKHNGWCQWGVLYQYGIFADSTDNRSNINFLLFSTYFDNFYKQLFH